MNFDQATAKIRGAALDVAKEMGEAYHSFAETEDRMVVRLLALAWIEAVRSEWENVANSDPVLKASLAVAKELMTENNYTADHICMFPGIVPMVCKIDGKDAVAVDACMANVVPLSAIFTNKVSEASVIAEKLEAVKKATAVAAAERPPEPPTPPTPEQNCWAFFGFDGQVDFDTLNARYTRMEPHADAPRHYLECMRELASSQGSS